MADILQGIDNWLDTPVTIGYLLAWYIILMYLSQPGGGVPGALYRFGYRQGRMFAAAVGSRARALREMVRR